MAGTTLRRRARAARHRRSCPTRRQAFARWSASSGPAGPSRCACGTTTGWSCSRRSTRRADALGDAGEGVLPYRNRASIEQLIPGAEMELLEVDADYTDFEDFWSALTGGAGPAGVWATSLDEERRIRRAHGALPPARRARWAVHADGTRLGRARYARVRTLSRSAPVPTSTTATSSSRSTKST